MIIIPEIKVVLITPPKTASRSLWGAIKAQYPLATHPYHHMESSMVPEFLMRAGYKVLGVFRPFEERMISLYNFMRKYPDKAQGKANVSQRYLNEMREAVSVPFNDWIFASEFCFVQPFGDKGEVITEYMCDVVRPENQKSMLDYLRYCDEVYSFNKMSCLLERLGLNEDAFPMFNVSKKDIVGGYSKELVQTCAEAFAMYDLQMAEMFVDHDVLERDLLRECRILAERR